RWPADVEIHRAGPFRWLLGAHGVSVLGDGIARVALVFAVLEITTSPAAVGLVLAAQSVPTVGLLLVGGVLGHTRSRTEIPVADLRDGWGECRARDWVWGIVVGSSLGNALLGVLWVLGPIVADRTLGGPAAWGLLVSALGAGSILGGLIALRVQPRRPLRVAT